MPVLSHALLGIEERIAAAEGRRVEGWVCDRTTWRTLLHKYSITSRAALYHIPKVRRGAALRPISDAAPTDRAAPCDADGSPSWAASSAPARERTGAASASSTRLRAATRQEPPRLAGPPPPLLARPAQISARRGGDGGNSPGRTVSARPATARFAERLKPLRRSPAARGALERLAAPRAPGALALPRAATPPMREDDGAGEALRLLMMARAAACPRIIFPEPIGLVLAHRGARAPARGNRTSPADSRRAREPPPRHGSRALFASIFRASASGHGRREVLRAVCRAGRASSSTASSARRAAMLARRRAAKSSSVVRESKCAPALGDECDADAAHRPHRRTPGLEARCSPTIRRSPSCWPPRSWRSPRGRRTAHRAHEPPSRERRTRAREPRAALRRRGYFRACLVRERRQRAPPACRLAHGCYSANAIRSPACGEDDITRYSNASSVRKRRCVPRKRVLAWSPRCSSTSTRKYSKSRASPRLTRAPSGAPHSRSIYTAPIVITHYIPRRGDFLPLSNFHQAVLQAQLLRRLHAARTSEQAVPPHATLGVSAACASMLVRR